MPKQKSSEVVVALRGLSLDAPLTSPDASVKAMEWAKAHPERARENSRRYREKHAEAIKIKRAAYYQANKEKINARAKAWKVANPDKARVIRRRAKNVRRTRKFNEGLQQLASLVKKLQSNPVSQCEP